MKDKYNKRHPRATPQDLSSIKSSSSASSSCWVTFASCFSSFSFVAIKFCRLLAGVLGASRHFDNSHSFFRRGEGDTTILRCDAASSWCWQSWRRSLTVSSSPPEPFWKIRQALFLLFNISDHLLSVHHPTVVVRLPINIVSMLLIDRVNGVRLIKLSNGWSIWRVQGSSASRDRWATTCLLWWWINE